MGSKIDTRNSTCKGLTGNGENPRQDQGVDVGSNGGVEVTETLTERTNLPETRIGDL